MIGRVVGQRFRVESVIGSGGMSVVYRATDLSLDRSVAIKMLIPRLAANTTAVSRFQYEGKAMSKLSHDNIVRVFEFGVLDEDIPYLVLELLSGTVLSKILQHRHHLSVEDTVLVAHQIASALSYAHSQGIVHRDMKPSNVLIMDSAGNMGPVKVIDFGIAKMLTESTGQGLTATGEICGSPLYMSPEQCKGLQVDYRSDIYSLGCILYECLTGFTPFNGQTALITMRLHDSEAPLTLKEATLGGSFPDAMEHIVARCLAKRPEDRYQSADELQMDLDRVIGGATAINQMSRREVQVNPMFGNDMRMLHSVTAKETSKREVSVGKLKTPLLMLLSVAVGAAGMAAWTHMQKSSPVAPPSVALAPVAPPAKVQKPPDPPLEDSVSAAIKEGDKVIDDTWAGRKDVLFAEPPLHVSEKGLKQLSEHHLLEIANFTNSEFNDSEMPLLSKLTTLRSVILNKCSVTGKGVESLEFLPNLRQLLAQNIMFTAPQLQHLNLGLQDLQLSYDSKKANIKVKDPTVSVHPLLRLNRLHRLILNGYKLPDASVEDLLQMKNLERLDVRGTRLSHSACKLLVSGLPHCAVDSRLSPEDGLYFAMSNVANVTDARKQLHDPRMRFVRNVQMANDLFERDDLKAIANDDNLVILNLGNRKEILDSDLGLLSPSIRDLDLSDTKITDRGVATLKRLKNLHRLMLRKCPKITDDALRLLSEHNSLELLNIQDNHKLSQKAIEKFLHACPNCAVWTN
jgi:hypothetical protein